MKVLWCWRCKMEIPMLDEDEFARVGAKRSALDRGEAVVAEYNRITGFNETNINAVWHHRISIYGPPCARCGKVLRTPIASKCFECGCPATKSHPQDSH